MREPGQPLGLTPFKYSLVDCHAKKDGFNFNEMINKTSSAKHYGGGLPVQFVVPNTAAMRAGVQPWDVILAINGQDIRQWTGDKCIAFLRALPADRNIDLRIIRSGGGGAQLILPQSTSQQQSLPPPPNAHQPSSSSSSSHHAPPPNAQQAPRAVNAMSTSQSAPVADANGLLMLTVRRNGDPLGMVPFKYTLQDAMDGKDQLDYGNIKRKLAFAEQHGGLPVQQVTEWAAAGKAGLKPMDVIVAVNGVYLKNLSGEAAINVIKAAPEGQDLILHIARSSTPIDAPNLQPVGGCCSCLGGSNKQNQAQLQSIDAISSHKSPMGTTNTYQQQPPTSSASHAQPPPSSASVPLSTTTDTTHQQGGGERWESFAL
jgi:membrane-associated protease RseP (regulator of RpoE activity)